MFPRTKVTSVPVICPPRPRRRRLLTAGAGAGVEYAAETAQMSQRNIRAVLAGTSAQDAKAEAKNILDRFPAFVVPVFETPKDVSSRQVAPRHPDLSPTAPR
jgi:hypothetical protein